MKRVPLTHSITTILMLIFLLNGCEKASTTEQSAKDIAGKSNAVPKPEPLTPVSEKKAKFFAFMMPMIEKANAKVLSERQQLEQLKKSIPDLNQKQSGLLTALAERYRVTDTTKPSEIISELLVRINIIPPSLVLAQAANESAWGTSRFAREGNNYFGQWCFKKGCGLVPLKRGAGEVHEVAKFSDPLASVESYIHNLNSHPKYALLRKLRQEAIDKGETPSGSELAEGLSGYSERGEAYVRELRNMIRYNRLGQYDNVNEA